MAPVDIQPSEHREQLARQHDTALIDRFILGSTAERVVTSAPYPVWTVRREPH